MIRKTSKFLFYKHRIFLCVYVFTKAQVLIKFQKVVMGMVVVTWISSDRSVPHYNYEIVSVSWVCVAVCAYGCWLNTLVH